MTDKAEPTMKQLAVAIDAHLKRFEADRDGINKEISRDRYTSPGNGLRSYYNAGASYIRGRFLRVVYVSYQGATNLTRDDAKTYLEMLDSGFIGRHFEALRRAKESR